MKNPIIPALLLASVLPCAASVDYVDEIWETHYDSDGNEKPGTLRKHSLEDKVSITGEIGVTDKAVYELRSYNDSDITDAYILDTKTIYGFAPQAEVTILSDSSATGIPRTRADKPFYVTHTVNNIQTDSENPHLNSAVLVYATDSGKVFDKVITDNVIAERREYTPSDLFGSSDYYNLEGEVTFYVVQNTTSTDSTYSYADEFDSQVVKVLPKVQGTLTGFDPEVTYSKLPTLTMNVKNVYPQASLQLRVHPEGDPDNYKVMNCAATFENLTDDLYTPEANITVTLDDELITSDGKWKFKWVHTSTAWGEEEIKNFDGSTGIPDDNIQYTSTINVRSRVSTSQ
ncbi:hypothetical protein [Rubritalea marina]|uniref:hypothetical protein n=1 Tax=Rubritalea marina TaxID=361055 RepID=UPI00035EE79B|nr:hypothetical protein [Rubritalea marina]